MLFKLFGYIVNHIKIYRAINEVENTLSRWAAVPVLGTIPGLIKAIMGVVQIVFGALLCIKEMVDYFMGRNKNLICHGWTHIQHGCGNVAGGLASSVPAVGTILYFVKHWITLYNVYNSFVTGHENKFMPYEELVKEDLKIGFLGFESQTEEDYAWHRGYPLIDISELYNYHETHDPDADKLKTTNATLNQRLIQQGGRANLTLDAIQQLAQTVLDEYKLSHPPKPEQQINHALDFEWDITVGLPSNTQ